MWKRVTEGSAFVAAVMAVVAIVTAQKADIARENMATWLRLVADCTPDWLQLNATQIAVFFAGLTVILWVGKRYKTGLRDYFWVPALASTPVHREVPWEGEVAWRVIQHIAASLGQTKDSSYFPQSRRLIRQAAYNAQLTVKGRKQIGANNLKWVYSDALTRIDSAY